MLRMCKFFFFHLKMSVVSCFPSLLSVSMLRGTIRVKFHYPVVSKIKAACPTKNLYMVTLRMAD